MSADDTTNHHYCERCKKPVDAENRRVIWNRDNGMPTLDFAPHRWHWYPEIDHADAIPCGPVVVRTGRD